MLALEWRPRAQLDRESIAIYIGSERNEPQRALRIIQQLDADIELLRENPGIGRRVVFEQLDHQDYRRLVSGSYLIYYRATKDTLTIHRIIHQRQDIDIYTLIEDF